MDHLLGEHANHGMGSKRVAKCDEMSILAEMIIHD